MMKRQTLKHSMKAYIPKVGNNGEDFTKDANKACAYFAKTFGSGGATLYDAVGLWEGMRDSIVVCDIRRSKRFSMLDAEVVALYIIEVFEQYAASVEIDGTLHIFQREE